jgi:hypothetical protein
MKGYTLSTNIMDCPVKGSSFETIRPVLADSLYLYRGKIMS